MLFTVRNFGFVLILKMAFSGVSDVALLDV